ncbi:hypothetical protein [Brevibacillus migulae]|nr:hypothetical protein [Brevibacillus migulae]
MKMASFFFLYDFMLQPREEGKRGTGEVFVTPAEVEPDSLTP